MALVDTEIYNLLQVWMCLGEGMELIDSILARIHMICLFENILYIIFFFESILWAVVAAVIV